MSVASLGLLGLGVLALLTLRTGFFQWADLAGAAIGSGTAEAYLPLAITAAGLAASLVPFVAAWLIIRRLGLPGRPPSSSGAWRWVWSRWTCRC